MDNHITLGVFILIDTLKRVIENSFMLKYSDSI